jgi:hypothetical protein
MDGPERTGHLLRLCRKGMVALAICALPAPTCASARASSQQVIEARACREECRSRYEVAIDDCRWAGRGLKARCRSDASSDMRQCLGVCRISTRIYEPEAEQTARRNHATTPVD